MLFVVTLVPIALSFLIFALHQKYHFFLHQARLISCIRAYSQKSSKALPAQRHGYLPEGMLSGKYQQGL